MPRRRRRTAPARRFALSWLPRWAGFAALGLVAASWLPVFALRFFAPPATAFMLQQAGLGRFQYHWTDWRALGTLPALAVLASEDQRFFEHHGFDLGAIETALADRAAGRPLRGASTITQQVAKNLFLWSGRSFVRKALEAWFTVLLEVTWPKRRILEMYLNIAEFGPGVYGVPAAAQRFFGKPPAALSAGDAALLAAVLPNPHELRADRPSGYVLERQRWILDQMGHLDRAVLGKGAPADAGASSRRRPKGGFGI